MPGFQVRAASNPEATQRLQSGTKRIEICAAPEAPHRITADPNPTGAVFQATEIRLPLPEDIK
jgi:hypothetical protein